MKVSRKWSEKASIFSKLQVYENIHEGFSFSIILKADFCNNVPLQIFSLVESCFIEIRVLLPVTLQKNYCKLDFWVFPEQVLFRSVFKPSQTSNMEVIAKLVIVLNVLTIFSKSSI